MDIGQEYKYIPLPLTPLSPVSPRHAIRLLDIRPSNELTAQVQCTLTIHTLHPDPPPIYEALSYTWGTGLADNPILINGRIFRVRSNLLQAIRRLRQPHAGRRIWCDAICTNQEDMDERTSSVKFMGSIYSQALGGVVVWFGEETTETHLVQEFIDRLNSAAEQIKQKQKRNEKKGKFFAKTTITAQVPGFTDPGYKILYDFLQTEWTSRVWVVQEVVLAPKDVKIKILRGGHVFDMQKVAEAMSCIYLCSVQQYTGIKYPARLGRIWGDRVERGANENRNFLNVMKTHAMAKSTDPRDKIYGLAGLAEDIKPVLDYGPNVTVSDVYTDFSRQWIRKYQNLSILAHLTCTTYNRNPELPSWIPDWTVWQPNPYLLMSPIASTKVRDIDYLSSLEHFTAAGKFSTMCQLTSSRDSAVSVEFEGHVLDIVAETAMKNSSKTTTVAEVLEFFSSCELVAGVGKVAICTMEAQFSKDRGDNGDIPTTETVLNTKAKYPATGESLLHAYYSALTMDDIYNDHVKHRLDGLNRSRRLLKGYTAFDKILHSLRNENDPRMQSAEWINVVSAARVCIDRKLVRTERKSYLGVFCERVQTGDAIVLLKGAKVPFAMRKVVNRDNEYWNIIGDGYLHGVMKGEAWRDEGCQKFVVV